MGKGRVLVLEDDLDISKMLRIYFDSLGYEVLVAHRGYDAVDICRKKLPHVATFDIQLPDIDGFEVCRILRSNTRTSYIPIIFYTQKDERSDKIAGLELGSDDYITKPFDIEELKLRVEGAIRRSHREALIHPVTNLPAGELIEEQLKRVKDSADSWTLLYFGIKNVNAFKDIYGPIQVEEVLIFLADIMYEAVEAYGTLNDFIGQASVNDFIIISTPTAASTICKTITERFNEECKVFYSFKDKEQGYITYRDINGVTQKTDFMKLAVGIVSSSDGPFADIVQITEDAAENRRQKFGGRDDIKLAIWFPTRSFDKISPIEKVAQPKGRILFADNDPNILKMLRIYFDLHGYEVLTAHDGNDAVYICRTKLPNVVILDVILDGINGHEVCRILRSNTRTSYIPIIFLTQLDKRSDKIAGLELGADDYITKPFNIEDLKISIEGAIRRTYSITNLPTGKVIEEQLKRVKDSAEPWMLLYFGIRNILAFKEVYSPIQVNSVLIFLADIMREAVEAYGTLNDFIGQASDNDFIIITTPVAAPVICETITQRFNEECRVFYSLSDRERGYIFYKNIDDITQKSDLMKLAVGVVSSSDGPFDDIVQITEDAAENRRYSSGCPDGDKENRKAGIDYSNQLVEHVSLWEFAPELAQTLIEVDHLTGAKIHDMSQIGVLLDMASKEELKGLPASTYSDLQCLQQLCRLTYENLNELRYKTRGYQKFNPVPLLETLEDTVNRLQGPQITVSSAGKTIPETEVAIPGLKLQQVIYNICTWLLSYDDINRVSIEVDEKSTTLTFTPFFTVSWVSWAELVKVMKQVASLIFSHLNKRKNSLEEISTLLEALNHNKPGAVYGYLAKKILSRYDGDIKLNKKQVILYLPPASQEKLKMFKAEVDKKITEQRSFLDKQKDLPSPPHISTKAADLIDPLAKDLLASIEKVLEIISTNPDINVETHPWSAIRRKLHFFRLLTLDLLKNQPFKPALVNLRELLESVKPLLAHKIIDHEVTVESEVENPILNTDRMRLWQIFVNLALNALEAMPEDGELKFCLKKEGALFVVEVKDNGPGIAPENLPRIFDLYFTTKGAGRGIGLYSVKQYVKELRGQIEVHSEVGKGTTFTVKLPPNWEEGFFNK